MSSFIIGGVAPSRPYTDNYLQAYSKEHVFYEIDMFFGVGDFIAKQALVRASSPNNVTRLASLVVEGFAIHVRNIIEFLYSKQPRPTDVVAADFCLPGAWEAARPSLSNTLETARVRADKELAHLTTARISGNPPEKTWEAAALMIEIKPLLKLFLITTQPTALADRVKNQINKC